MSNDETCGGLPPPAGLTVATSIVGRFDGALRDAVMHVARCLDAVKLSRPTRAQRVVAAMVALARREVPLTDSDVALESASMRRSRRSRQQGPRLRHALRLQGRKNRP